MKRSVLSEKELKELLAVDLEYARTQNAKWFWIRTTIGLGYIAAMLIALTMFPERIFSRFDLPEQSIDAIRDVYIPVRIVTLVILSTAYVVSYLKQWYFPYVAFAAILISIGNLLNDYFTFYIYVAPSAEIIVYVITVARFLLIILLYLNFRFAISSEVKTSSLT